MVVSFFSFPLMACRMFGDVLNERDGKGVCELSFRPICTLSN